MLPEKNRVHCTRKNDGDSQTINLQLVTVKILNTLPFHRRSKKVRKPLGLCTINTLAVSTIVPGVCQVEPRECPSV